MFIVNFKGAEKAIIDGSLTDKQAQKHVVAMGLFVLFGLITSAGMYLIGEGIVAFFSYKSNGKNDFIRRYSVLGFPAMIRCLLFEIIVSMKRPAKKRGANFGKQFASSM